MSGIGSAVETAVETAVPGLSLAKWVAIGIAGLVVVALVSFMVWKTFFAGGAAEAKHDVVQAKGNAAISDAGALSAKDAIPVITNNYNYAAKSDKQTEADKNAILQAPGAGQKVDPALDALVRHDICMRASASGLPECKPLLGPHS